MATRSLAVFVIVILSLLLALFSGCGSQEAESQPYGPPQVQFPQDEGVHPESGIEWWYLNSILTDSEGHEYGAMAAYFNPGLKILSISDIEAEQSYPEVSFSVPDYAEGTLDLRWGENDHWFRTDDESLTYRLEANGTEIGLSLDLSSLKPPLLVGGDGLIEWTDESTYYYSLTRLQIEGQIELSGNVIDIEGSGWMDHQWMDSLSERGWDWFSVQLDNNTEVIFWQIVNTDESIESCDMTIMFPDNSVYHTQDITMERLDSWVSPTTGNEYGTVWRVQEDVHGLDLEIRARYPEQEVRVLEDFEGMDFDFWEGGTTVSGHLAGEAVSGTGYAELVRMPTNVPEDAPNPWE
jgi:predicted secreted hydrolase